MFLRFRSALPLALARTFPLWFGTFAPCRRDFSFYDAIKRFLLRQAIRARADGNDRQSEGVVRIASNTLSPKGKEAFTESALKSEVILASLR